MASHSQLKYGARLINSYLGNNATISCCEVLNSLIFPAHEQHHNNSFLCASLVMGQSNIAAGATIGSNHNSRSPDGELIAGRGFWPGLCVSLKHNSMFASFTIIAKGDYSAELNIPLPFSLISNDFSNNQLVIMPCYWFMYNMYALARNEKKYIERDKRVDRQQHIEYDYLAPDSVNEIFTALRCLKLFTGEAYFKKNEPGQQFTEQEKTTKGFELLEAQDAALDELEILASGFENNGRKVLLIKVRQAYQLYKELIVYYFCQQLIAFHEKYKPASFEAVTASLPKKTLRNEWLNVGGQLIPSEQIHDIKNKIKIGKVKSWDMLHRFYQKQAEEYPQQKLAHAFGSVCELTRSGKVSKELLGQLLDQAVATKSWMSRNIYDSRAKDYSSPYRKMMYSTDEEMKAVIGKLEENSFIEEQKEQLRIFRQQVSGIKKRFGL
jgi:hypothetical protein